jgi:hypothetical protein
MNKFLIILIFLITSCSEVVTKIDQNFSNSKSSDKLLNLVFSHNISGETHPCGCRQFPLGGLPQVHGLFESLKSKGKFLYVDTGDTFFPSSNIPKSMTDSLSFAANDLANGLDMVGLSFFVPGDQDFALGLDFLKTIANNHKFNFLISNLKDESVIKHKRFAIIKESNATLFLIGIVNPETINSKDADYFKNANESINEMLKELPALGYEPKNLNHRIILLSHSGIELDEKIAEKFPQIDWIIGAHSQSFLRYSKDVGNVKLVQTLSKNHYVGNISFDLLNNKNTDSYVLHEIRDELEKNVTPNPLRDFINAHKTKMNELQIKEQLVMSNFAESLSNSTKKYQSVYSCLECHKVQVDFWQGTPHSMAYATLMNVKEQNNLQCIKCHSLGLNDPKGFTTTKHIISFKDHPIIDYWNQAHDLSSKVPSIRKLNSKELKVLSKKWMELDRKNNVKNNFANVQCLNCHENHDEHPFEISVNNNSEEKISKIKAKCLGCHTIDQSPEWYVKNEKGLPSNLNNSHFMTLLKKMSCPLVQ